MKITYLTLMLTNACNLKCPMCGQNSFRSIQHRTDLSLDKIIEVIESLPDLRTVYLFGGEPTIYKDFIPLLNYLKKKDLKILITTNGILDDKQVESIVDCEVDNVTFSIDTIYEKKYSKVRSKNELQKVIKSLDSMIAIRKKKDKLY